MKRDPASAAEVAASGSIQNLPLRRLFDYWAGLASGDAVPLERQLDIANLPPKTRAHMLAIAILDGERNYRVTMLGSYLVAVYGRDYTGCRLVDEEIPRVTRSITYALLDRLARDRRPLCYHGPSGFRFAGFDSPHEQIMMPLCDDAGRIVAAVGAIDFPDARPNDGYRF